MDGRDDHVSGGRGGRVVGRGGTVRRASTEEQEAGETAARRLYVRQLDGGAGGDGALRRVLRGVRRGHAHAGRRRDAGERRNGDDVPCGHGRQRRGRERRRRRRRGPRRGGGGEEDEEEGRHVEGGREAAEGAGQGDGHVAARQRRRPARVLRVHGGAAPRLRLHAHRQPP